MQELDYSGQRESLSWMPVATVGLVWVLFLNGVVFLTSQGGGQWVLPVQKPATGFVAGGSTAGFAQLGIVVFVAGGGQEKLKGTVVGSGWGTRGSAPGMVQGCRSIWDTGCCANCCRGIASGFGAGGSNCRRMHCGVQS